MTSKSPRKGVDALYWQGRLRVAKASMEAAQQAIKEEGKIRDLYLRVSEKKGHNRGVVAAARELVVSIFWMLKRMEPYRASGKKLSVSVTSEVG